MNNQGAVGLSHHPFSLDAERLSPSGRRLRRGIGGKTCQCYAKDIYEPRVDTRERGWIRSIHPPSATRASASIETRPIPRSSGRS